jgi:hypothetical protein
MISLPTSLVSRLPRFLALASLVLASLWVATAARAQGTPPPGYAYACAEGQRCVIGPYSRDVAYGVGPGSVAKRFAMTGTFDCNNDQFGGDPAKRQKKACYVSALESRRVGCAVQDATCTVSGTQTVMYGVDGSYVSAQKSGSFTCNGNAFGGADPARGRQKACFIGAPY